jgi:hypothetical protein
MKTVIIIIGALCLAFFLALGLTGCAAGVTDSTDPTIDVLGQGGGDASPLVAPPPSPPAPPATACTGPLAAELVACVAQHCTDADNHALCTELWCGLLIDDDCPPAELHALAPGGAS